MKKNIEQIKNLIEGLTRNQIKEIYFALEERLAEDEVLKIGVTKHDFFCTKQYVGFDRNYIWAPKSKIKLGELFTELANNIKDSKIPKGTTFHCIKRYNGEEYWVLADKEKDIDYNFVRVIEENPEYYLDIEDVRKC